MTNYIITITKEKLCDMISNIKKCNNDDDDVEVTIKLIADVDKKSNATKRNICNCSICNIKNPLKSDKHYKIYYWTTEKYNDNVNETITMTIDELNEMFSNVKYYFNDVEITIKVISDTSEKLYNTKCDICGSTIFNITKKDCNVYYWSMKNKECSDDLNKEIKKRQDILLQKRSYYNSINAEECKRLSSNMYVDMDKYSTIWNLEIAEKIADFNFKKESKTLYDNHRKILDKLEAEHKQEIKKLYDDFYKDIAAKNAALGMK